MRRLVIVLFIWFSAALPSQAVPDIAELRAPFRSETFTHDELRIVQLGLILVGHYNGILDGKWGAISSKALSGYSYSEFSEPPKNIHLTSLIFEAVDFLDSSEWEIINFDDPTFSIIVPTKHRSEVVESENYFSFSHSESSLNYSISFSGLDKVVNFHKFAMSEAKDDSNTYTVRNKNRIVTSVEKRNNQLLYVRSDLVDNVWTTVLLSAFPQDKNILNAVAGSIRFNNPYEFTIPENGKLAQVLDTVIAIANEPKQTTEPKKTETPKNALIGTGSGYVISNQGHILTNAHVIEDCQTLKVNETQLDIIAQSELFDLAVLQSKSLLNTPHAQFATSTISLNQDISVAGFPFSDLLSSLNVTRGNVSAITGLKGDNINFQISAPVQAGNSGGPVFDKYGAVIGTVVAKLSPKATGSLPENINFAVRNEIAQLFLSQNRIPISFNANNTPLSAVDLGILASNVTQLIECYN